DVLSFDQAIAALADTFASVMALFAIVVATAPADVVTSPVKAGILAANKVPLERSAADLVARSARLEPDLLTSDHAIDTKEKPPDPSFLQNPAPLARLTRR